MGLNIYVIIYREMLKKILFKNHKANFNQTRQETCLGWGFRFVEIKRLNKEHFNKSSKIFFS